MHACALAGAVPIGSPFFDIHRFGRTVLDVDTYLTLLTLTVQQVPLVTEFGRVNLKGMSSTERAEAMIGLAHPEFRDHLAEQARHLHLV